MSAANKPQPNQRLGSWKEIAAFFGCDERTLRRWEKERGLPIHRAPGGSGGKVFAFTDELSAWLAAPKPDSPKSERPSPEVPEPPAVQANQAKLQPPRTLRLLIAALLCLTVVAFAIFYRSPSAGPHSIAPSEAAPVTAAAASRNPEAEKLYLEGRYYWNRRTPESLNKAVDYFTQAIVRDPGYALAYVGLADCYNLLREYANMPPSEAYPRALAAARKAVELDDRSSEAHASLAFALFYGQWDIPGADQEFRRAINLNPNNAAAHHWYATYLMTLRRFPESLAEIERAQILDPHSTTILADQGLILVLSGRRNEGVALWKRIEAAEPSFRSPHAYLKEYDLEHGDYAGFFAESKKDAALVHDKTSFAITAAAEKGFASGGANGLFQEMLQAEQQLYAQGAIAPYTLACTYGAVGDRDGAIRYLNTAFTQHDESMLAIENVWTFRTLHHDPAFLDLLDRMHLPPIS